MRDLLLKAVRLVLKTGRPSKATGSPQCVLILQYAMPLGCCVHGTPLYAALEAALPGLTLIVATRGSGRQTLAHDPHIDHLLETGDPTGSLPDLWRVARRIRSQLSQLGLRPDWVLQDANNRRGSFALLAAALRLAPIAGFANLPELYDVFLPYDDALSLIDNNLRLPGIFSVPSPHREPGVYFTAAELEGARSLLGSSTVVGEGLRPTIAYAVQGSGGQLTAWHNERTAAVVRHMELKGCRSVFVGTPADTPRIEQVCRLAASDGDNLAGRTTIPELAALLCLCDLLITIDTGTLHVGRAAQLPLVVLGPSWQRPLEWLPLQVDHARVLRGQDVPAAPAGYQLDEIEVAAVLAAASDLLQRFPASTAARESRVQRLLSGTRP